MKFLALCCTLRARREHAGVRTKHAGRHCTVGRHTHASIQRTIVYSPCCIRAQHISCLSRTDSHAHVAASDSGEGSNRHRYKPQSRLSGTVGTTAGTVSDCSVTEARRLDASAHRASSGHQPKKRGICAISIRCRHYPGHLDRAHDFWSCDLSK